MKARISSALIFLSLIFLSGKSLASSEDPANIYQFANQCYNIKIADSDSYLSKQGGAYSFSGHEQASATRFYMRPATLGIYLLFDQDRQYLIGENGKLAAVNRLESEMTRMAPEQQVVVTPGEWQLQAKENSEYFLLKNINGNFWIAENGVSTDINEAATLDLKSTSGCAQFPEALIGASGKINKTKHEDGSLWGFVDAHEHSTGNYGFGGKAFHGANFHKLGIEHALADCEKHHGEGGSKDIMSVVYQAGSSNIPASTLLKKIFKHLVWGDPTHNTEGYPEMTDWSHLQTPTHQALYYKWIERSYLGGMRLMVEYFESTEVVCEIYKGINDNGANEATCNEMDHVDFQINKMKGLQDYVDAQSGGPGKGWLRIVYSPEQAREVIAEGKLAIILGIENENPFNCFVDEREGFEPCDGEKVRKELSRYYQKGIRALFPSHKFVNAYSAGDGDAGILELGDFLNTGQWRQYVNCEDVPGQFWMKSHNEGKEVSLFAGLADFPGMKTLNRWLSEGDDMATQALPIYPPADNHCQKNGFTPLGMELINEMMSLGMIIDLGHTPKAGLNDLVPVLVENDYPAVHTHGGDQDLLNLLNGISTRGLASACRDNEGNSPLQGSFDEIAAQVNPETGMPRKGLSYDFNGFAGYNKPRFGELSKCENEQQDPLQYPFTSLSGDIVFEKLQTGERTFDFNTDGLANIGLYPDLIEEARRSGASEEGLNALFKTAESYIRIWERAESFNQSKQLRSESLHSGKQENLDQVK